LLLALVFILTQSSSAPKCNNSDWPQQISGWTLDSSWY